MDNKVLRGAKAQGRKLFGGKVITDLEAIFEENEVLYGFVNFNKFLELVAEHVAENDVDVYELRMVDFEDIVLQHAYRPEIDEDVETVNFNDYSNSLVYDLL